MPVRPSCASSRPWQRSFDHVRHYDHTDAKKPRRYSADRRYSSNITHVIPMTPATLSSERSDGNEKFSPSPSRLSPLLPTARRLPHRLPPTQPSACARVTIELGPSSASKARRQPWRDPKPTARSSHHEDATGLEPADRHLPEDSPRYKVLPAPSSTSLCLYTGLPHRLKCATMGRHLRWAFSSPGAQNGFPTLPWGPSATCPTSPCRRSPDPAACSAMTQALLPCFGWNLPSLADFGPAKFGPKWTVGFSI
jgi:hypothetical protein